MNTIEISVTRSGMSPRYIEVGAEGQKGGYELSLSFDDTWSGLDKSVVFYDKRREKVVSYDFLADGAVSVVIPEGAMAEDGRHPFLIVGAKTAATTDGGTVTEAQKLSECGFICVGETVYPELNTASTDELDADAYSSFLEAYKGCKKLFDAMSEKYDKIVESLGTGQSYAALSESYAKGGTGKREGESTDNSKYYSEVAAGKATAAESSAGKAKTYAEEAATNAESTNTALSEMSNMFLTGTSDVTIAKEKAEAAQGKAEAAQGKAEIAQAAAEAAKKEANTAAATASAYVTAAASSEANAKEYADSAERFKNSAATAEANAKKAESNASDSEKAAKAYKDEACEAAENVAGFAEVVEEDMLTASERAAEAEVQATASKSYAVGGTGRRSGEDTDNAKYYYREAKECAEIASTVVKSQNSGESEPVDASAVVDIFRCAMTYVNNKSGLTYTDAGSGTLFDSDYSADAPKIDCSSAVTAWVRGIPYEWSKYAGKGNTKHYGYGLDLPPNPYAADRPDRYYSHELARYFQSCGWCFKPDSSYSNIAPGDIIFVSFANRDGTYDFHDTAYMKIDHCLLVLGYKDATHLTCLHSNETSTLGFFDVPLLPSEYDETSTSSYNNAIKLVARLPFKSSGAISPHPVITDSTEATTTSSSNSNLATLTLSSPLKKNVPYTLIAYVENAFIQAKPSTNNYFGIRASYSDGASDSTIFSWVRNEYPSDNLYRCTFVPESDKINKLKLYVLTTTVAGHKYKYCGLYEGAVSVTPDEDGTFHDNKVTSASLADGAVTTSKVADKAITGAKIADSAITSSKLAYNSVPSTKIVGPIAVAKGGTGKTSWVANGLPYPSSSTAFTQLAFPTAESVLCQKTSGAPYWKKLSEIAGSSGGYKKIGYTDDCDYKVTSASGGKTAFTNAINAAASGDTILVMPGEYGGTGRLDITKNLNFLGVGMPEIKFSVNVGSAVSGDAYTFYTANFNGFALTSVTVDADINNYSGVSKANLYNCRITGSAGIAGMAANTLFAGGLTAESFASMQRIYNCRILKFGFDMSASCVVEGCDITVKDTATGSITPIYGGIYRSCVVRLPSGVTAISGLDEITNCTFISSASVTVAVKEGGTKSGNVLITAVTV